MNKQTCNLWLLAAALVMFAVCLTVVCQGNTALRSLDRCKAEVSRLEDVRQFLATTCRLQVRDIKCWEAKNLALAEQVVELKTAWEESDALLYKELNGIMADRLQETNDLWVEANNILIGRIDKITSAFHVHVMELLAEIERLKGELHLCRFSFPPNKIPDDLEPTCQ